MENISERLLSALTAKNIPFERISHLRDYTSQETAQHTRTPGSRFAKSVLLWVEGHQVMAVIPAHHRIDWGKARAVFGTQDVSLASEEEISRTFADCELGAAPPFGNLYDIPVYLSRDLDRSSDIVFNAGTHVDVVKMKYSDYDELVHPEVVDISHPLMALH